MDLYMALKHINLVCYRHHINTSMQIQNFFHVSFLKPLILNFLLGHDAEFVVNEILNVKRSRSFGSLEKS